jgi:tetratricopeptide (TPR) repeat protein
MSEQAAAARKSMVASLTLQRVLYALCGVFIVAIIAVVLVEGVTWGKGELLFAQDDGAGLQHEGKDMGQSYMSSNEEMEERLEAAEKKTSERINRQLEHSKMLLDGLVTLVGVYSILLGLTALVTVKFSRDDAKEQLKTLRDDAKEQMKTLQDKLHETLQSFPQFKEMDKQMELLLRRIELSIPSQAMWEKEGWSEKLKEEVLQLIRDSEVTIAAVSVFALNRNVKLKRSLLAIYRNLARYYADRSVVAFKELGPKEESDYVRALGYATQMIELAPESSDGYRQRGAIVLDRYRLLLEAQQRPSRKKLAKLLDDAEWDLAEAIHKSTVSRVDAGAYYNMALVKCYRNRLEEAVAMSRQLLAQGAQIQSMDRENYLPDVYRNLGCYLARLASAAKKKQETKIEDERSNEAVEAIRIGVDDFLKTRALDTGLEQLEAGIKKELGDKGDFSALKQHYRLQLEALANPKKMPATPEESTR